MSNDTMIELSPTRDAHRNLVAELAVFGEKHQQLRAKYKELKTHIQDVLNDTGAWGDFDEEKLAKHGIVKPPTLYSCEYEVKYTGTVTVKADDEEAARNKADEIVSNAILCQLSQIDDDEVTDQNHNDFDLEINGCEEQ